MHFGAYVHVMAIAWVCAFAELRALTNATVVDLNPIELHEVLDSLWDFADVLKGDEPFQVLHAGYRPWPKLRQGHVVMQAWYDKREPRHQREIQTLREYRGSHSEPAYLAVLRDVLQMFGSSVHVSLERSMKDHLEHTTGPRASSKLTNPEKNLVRKIRYEHDNAASGKCTNGNPS